MRSERRQERTGVGQVSRLKSFDKRSVDGRDERVLLGTVWFTPQPKEVRRKIAYDRLKARPICRARSMGAHCCGRSAIGIAAVPLRPCQPREAAYDYFLQGTSAGWGDTYDWLLPDQYIEVSGVPDGVYILETTADPDKLLQEVNDRNNCIAIYVQLSGLATSSPSAQILGPGPRCPK